MARNPHPKSQKRSRAQVSVELAMMASVTLSILLVAFLVNESLSSSWERQKQKLEAGFAADNFAVQVGKAVSGGSGTKVRYFNSVMPDVTSMSLYENQSIIAYTASGVSSTAPLVTRNITAIAGVPINAEIIITNTQGAIAIEAV